MKMAEKKDWGKVLQILVNNETVKHLASVAAKKVVDLAKAGMPYRKATNAKIEYIEAELAALKETVKQLLEDKIESDGNSSS